MINRKHAVVWNMIVWNWRAAVCYITTCIYAVMNKWEYGYVVIRLKILIRIWGWREREISMDVYEKALGQCMYVMLLLLNRRVETLRKWWACASGNVYERKKKLSSRNLTKQRWKNKSTNNLLIASRRTWN